MGEKQNREIVLEAYVKVADADRQQILAQSGNGGVFVMELAKDTPRPVVDWIAPGEAEGPAYLALAARKAHDAKSSLAFRRGGGASIGVKVPAAQAGDRIFTWRARQVPHTWSVEDLEAALSDVGFSSFEVISPGRGRLPWLFRAQLKADAGQPALAIQVGKITVDVERAVAKRKLVNFESTRLNVAPTTGASSKGGNKGATTAAAMIAKSAKSAAGQPAAIVSPAQGSQQGASTESPAGAPGGPRQRSRSPPGRTEAWCDVHECGGSGSCFCNVVGAHFAMHRDKFDLATSCKLAKARGATLRAELAGYIREKAASFKPYWVPPAEPANETEKVNLQQMEGGDPPACWEEYLKALDRPNRWADDLTFRAATKRLNCRLILIVGDINKPSQLISYGKVINFKDRQQVVVPILYKDKHYQWIVPKEGKSLPEEWLQLEPGSHTQPVPRGGGWLPSRTSSRTSSKAPSEIEDPAAWLPPRSVSSASSRAGGEGRAWLPSRMATSSEAPSGALPAQAFSSARGTKRKASIGVALSPPQSRQLGSDLWVTV